MTENSDDTPENPRIENEATAELIEHALFNLWSVANDLSRIQPPSDRFHVTIFGSARVSPSSPVYDQVKNLARHLAEMGCDIVTGGGPGLMQAANEGEKLGDPDSQTDSVGIRVDLPFEQETNPYATTVYSHRTFFTRLHHFVRLSDAFIVVEGGIGTTLEMVMVWQLLQVEHIDNVPLILIGEMWEELLTWARDNLIREDFQFADPEDIEIPHCVETVDEAVEIIGRHYDESSG